MDSEILRSAFEYVEKSETNPKTEGKWTDEKNPIWNSEKIPENRSISESHMYIVVSSY